MHHDILLKKLNCEFGVKGSLLDLICNYLSGRQQFTVLNGVKLFFLPVSMGIPQGLFMLFTNDLPSSVPSGSVYMYADDTTICCRSTESGLARVLQLVSKQPTNATSQKEQGHSF